MSSSTKRLLTGAAAVLFTALAATAVWAQPALKMTIPANPGGGWDQAGRGFSIRWR